MGPHLSSLEISHNFDLGDTQDPPQPLPLVTQSNDMIQILESLFQTLLHMAFGFNGGFNSDSVEHGLSA